MLHPRPLFSPALAVLRVQATLLAVVTVTQLLARCCWIVLMRSLSVLVQARLLAFMMVKQLVGADAAGIALMGSYCTCTCAGKPVGGRDSHTAIGANTTEPWLQADVSHQRVRPERHASKVKVPCEGSQPLVTTPQGHMADKESTTVCPRVLCVCSVRARQDTCQLV